MSDVKVSVIIPVYNSERFLTECLDSVISQTLRDIEIICVNDGSTDNSLDILKRYSDFDNRFKIINQKHSAPGNVRNAGLDVAQGQYISFIDSDDFVDNQFLEKLIRKATFTDSDITITNVYLNFMDTQKLQVFHDEAFYTFLKNKVFKATEYPEIVRILAPWDRIYKRSFLQKFDIRYPENVIYEDRLFAIECYVHAHRITVVNETLYYYRKNAGNAITDKELKNNNFKSDFLEMTSKSIELMKSAGQFDAFAYDYLLNHFENGLMHQRSISNKDYFTFFFEGMRSLLNESDYEIVQAIPDKHIAKYAKFLRDNELQKCYHCLAK